LKKGWDFTHFGHEGEATHRETLPQPVVRGKGGSGML
jgi:hypothetical protein